MIAIRNKNNSFRNWQVKVKYCFSFILSAIGLVVAFPLMGLISIAIVLDSKGNPFFWQERIGKDGKVFNICKFRTMVIGAEKKGDGLIIKDGNDARITRVGKFLRRTSLDEIPQLINVFRGEMSFIGPRPPVTYHPYDGYDNYSEHDKIRFQMRPGMTGLAAVKMRNSATWDERIKIDVEYVENYSLWLDVKVLFMTVFAMINNEEYTS